MTEKNREIIVILHNIRSIHNVGSIFRTADATGVKEIFLTGYTPAPVDRFGRKVKALSKVSLGAEESVKWQSYKKLSDVVSVLHEKSFVIAAVEQALNSSDYRSFEYPEKIALVFGSEPRGLSKQATASCDAVIEIPMRGEKESLNVSVAAGIMLYEATRNTK